MGVLDSFFFSGHSLISDTNENYYATLCDPQKAPRPSSITRRGSSSKKRATRIWLFSISAENSCSSSSLSVIWFFFFLKRHLSSSSLSELHRKWAFWWPVSPVRFVICPTTCWWAAGPVNLPKTWQWHNFRPDPEARKLGVSVLFFGHCPPAKRCTSRKLESETLHCH